MWSDSFLENLIAAFVFWSWKRPRLHQLNMCLIFLFFLGSFQMRTKLNASWFKEWLISSIQWVSKNSSLSFHHHQCLAHLIASIPTPCLQCQLYVHCLRYLNFDLLLINQTGFLTLGFNAKQWVVLKDFPKWMTAFNKTPSAFTVGGVSKLPQVGKKDRHSEFSVRRRSLRGFLFRMCKSCPGSPVLFPTHSPHIRGVETGRGGGASVAW